jgi:hypothetical protein
MKINFRWLAVGIIVSSMVGLAYAVVSGATAGSANSRTFVASNPAPALTFTPTLTAVPTLSRAPTDTTTATASPTATASATPTKSTTPTNTQTPSKSAPLTPRLVTATPNISSTDPVFVGAGDIADCGLTSDEATSKLLDSIPGTVFTVGDNAYPYGTADEFAKCYASSWGRHKSRTRPVPGNHDYATGNASGYFGYFGASAGDPTKGYYSYGVGAWHIIALNSEIAVGAGSKQEQWLRADLAAHPAMCTLAYWHKPRFSSGPHNNDATYEALWQALYDGNADVVLNGHDHDYERFAPQDPLGRADAVRGIREFVVGTGGETLYPFTNIRPNSELRRTGVFGVLKLTLHATSYDWQFISAAGNTFTDSGTGACH